VSSPNAIEVDAVSKRFRLYHEVNRSLKATIMRRRRVSYEEFWALRDVSLDVKAGETFGLIGENGSGKSTPLKCMARILRPDGGSIAVTGKVSALLELGAGFHPELTGRENVFLNASILGLGGKELRRKFDDIVAFAGLERFIDTPVKSYSSGMYVRLGFSVAINVEPDVLLVDEVLAVGDEQFQRRCREKFMDLKSEGRTVVLVSHAMGSLRSLCDRAAWLEEGVVREVGPVHQVADAYVGEVDDAPHSETEARWGSGEMRIDEIELLDEAGVPTHRVRTGEPVTVRLTYSTRQPIAGPVFGLVFTRADGLEVAGINTSEEVAVLTRVDGSGRVDLVIDRVPFLAGSYELTPSIFDSALVNAIDVRQRAFRFDVVSSPASESYGVISLGGRWRVDELGRAS
jgi:ABC-type polysaccharide/polyol phosphate transport system ATPase subunit